jgi:DNA-binding transcriptional ArsR family regulator
MEGIPARRPVLRRVFRGAGFASIPRSLKSFHGSPILPVKRSLRGKEGSAMRAPLAQVRVESPDAAIALLHPTRSRILTRLREPASSTEVARSLGLPPSRVNHHVRRLRRAGLVRRAGSRRVRNLTEILWVATARTYLISDALTPGGERRSELRREAARRGLRNLVTLGESLCGEALVLLDEAAWNSREISTYATSVELEFPDRGSRAAFLADLLEAVRSLKRKYGVHDDVGREERYRTVIACYPD